MIPAVGDKNVVTKPATTTVDTKCGSYATVDTAVLNFLFVSSFNNNARIILAGNTSNMLHTLIKNEFLITRPT